MTNEEAIKGLKCYHREDGTVPEELTVAIQALEKIDKIENLKEPLCEDYSIKVRKILRGDL